MVFPNARSGYVVSDRYTDAISDTGNHYGYEYRGLVHCNIYPEGLSINTWIHSFHAFDDLVYVYRNGMEIMPDAAGIYH